MFLITMLGSQEVLVLSSILGGIFGFFLRNKSKKNGAILSIIVGFVSAIIFSYLLATYFVASIILLPVYALTGSWLGNLALKKIV